VVAGLRNAHDDLAQGVADGLGLTALVDDGFVALGDRDDVEQVLTRCAGLRHWDRQMAPA
jgi:hypothetical protein